MLFPQCQHVLLKKMYDILKSQTSKKLTVWCNFFAIVVCMCVRALTQST